jgi:hypothetical protein
MRGSRFKQGKVERQQKKALPAFFLTVLQGNKVSPPQGGAEQHAHGMGVCTVMHVYDGRLCGAKAGLQALHQKPLEWQLLRLRLRL